MIELPRRSVTRFFIPLIDVLTLLFCIFLLMPFVKRTDAGEGSDPSTPAGEYRPPTVDLTTLSPAELARLVEEERRELERLRKEKMDTLQQRLTIRVLEIDADTGKLAFHDPDRIEIASQTDAQSLIDRQKREAGSRELYFLILFPRRLTGYPEQGQVRQYERWFQGVAHGFDNPRGR